jgi:hypothetical protein
MSLSPPNSYNLAETQSPEKTFLFLQGEASCSR